MRLTDSGEQRVSIRVWLVRIDASATAWRKKRTRTNACFIGYECRGTILSNNYWKEKKRKKKWQHRIFKHKYARNWFVPDQNNPRSKRSRPKRSHNRTAWDRNVRHRKQLEALKLFVPSGFIYNRAKFSYLRHHHIAPRLAHYAKTKIKKKKLLPIYLSIVQYAGMGTL